MLQQILESKVRSKSQSSDSRGKIRGFNTKGYFCNVQPYCQQYLRVKHAIYEKSKKLRQAKHQGKQNNPVMFQFNKPKSGFYQLKGCKISKITPEINSKSKQQIKTNNKGKQYLNYFIKKYAQRKQRKQNQNQIPESLLPILKTNPVSNLSLQQKPQSIVHSDHSKSIGLQICHLLQMSKNTKKLKTQPMGSQKRKNKSCQNLQKKYKINNWQNIQFSKMSITKPCA